MVITPEIKSGDLAFDSQPRPWIFHLLQWVSISVPEYLYIYCMFSSLMTGHTEAQKALTLIFDLYLFYPQKSSLVVL